MRLAALARHGVVCASECLRKELPCNTVNTPRDLVIVAIREGLPEKRALGTGKDADFLLFYRDPWEGGNNVEATYIDGEKVFEFHGPSLTDLVHRGFPVV